MSHNYLVFFYCSLIKKLSKTLLNMMQFNKLLFPLHLLAYELLARYYCSTNYFLTVVSTKQDGYLRASYLRASYLPKVNAPKLSITEDCTTPSNIRRLVMRF